MGRRTRPLTAWSFITSPAIQRCCESCHSNRVADEPAVFFRKDGATGRSSDASRIAHVLQRLVRLFARQGQYGDSVRSLVRRCRLVAQTADSRLDVACCDGVRIYRTTRPSHVSQAECHSRRGGTVRCRLPLPVSAELEHLQRAPQHCLPCEGRFARSRAARHDRSPIVPLGAGLGRVSRARIPCGANYPDSMSLAARDDAPAEQAQGWVDHFPCSTSSRPDRISIQCAATSSRWVSAAGATGSSPRICASRSCC